MATSEQMQTVAQNRNFLSPKRWRARLAWTSQPSSVIRLGPLFDGDALEKAKRDEIPEGRWYYSRSGFDLFPNAAVVVDHDLDRRVGTIDELVRWSDGVGEWLADRCRIDDPPEWLRRDTPASVGFVDFVSHPLGRGTRFGGGFVKEVSLVSPSETPRDAAAQVVLLREAEYNGELIDHSLGARGVRCGPILRRNTGTILGNPMKSLQTGDFFVGPPVSTPAIKISPPRILSGRI